MRQTLTIKYQTTPNGIRIESVEPKDIQWPDGINEVPTNYDADALKRVMRGGRWEKVSDDGHVMVFEREA